MLLRVILKIRKKQIKKKLLNLKNNQINKKNRKITLLKINEQLEIPRKYLTKKMTVKIKKKMMIIK